MVRNTHWIGISILSAVLMGALVAGCGKQDNNPDNTPGSQTNSSGNKRSDDNTPGNHMPGNNMPGNNMPGNNTPGKGMGNMGRDR